MQGICKPVCACSARSAALTGSTSRQNALHRRDDARAGVVGALVVEQGAEGVALERVDEADDLVRLEVVVVLHGGVWLGRRVRLGPSVPVRVPRRAALRLERPVPRRTALTLERPVPRRAPLTLERPGAGLG